MAHFMLSPWCAKMNNYMRGGGGGGKAFQPFTFGGVEVVYSSHGYNGVPPQ